MKLTNAGLVALVACCIFAVIAADMVTVRNDFVRTENQLKAIVMDSKNVHASFTNGLRTQGLAVEKYSEMVVKACAATYGEGGAKAAVLLLQKQHPDIDASVISRLQVAIEAGYARFEKVQQTRIDTVRIYRNKTEEFPTSVVAWLGGFPRMNLDEMEKIVTSAETKKVFESGEMEPVDPFQAHNVK